MSSTKKLCLIALAFVLAEAPVKADVLTDLQPGQWAAISQNTLANVDPCPARNCVYSANEGQRAVIDDWNGGAMATGFGSRGTYLVWGGGHNGYFGNELYGFDLATLRWSRLSEPSTNMTCNQSEGELGDGTPCSSHTYDGVEYHPGTNSFIRLGSTSNHATGGGGSPRVHLFDLDTRSWVRGGRNINIGYGMTGGVTAYHPGTGLFYVQPAYNYSFGTYNVATQSWTAYTPTNLSIDGAAAIDPDRELMLIVSPTQGRVYRRDLRNVSAAATTAATNIAPPVTTKLGFDWDSTAKKFVAWNGGNSVYTLTPPAGDGRSGTYVWETINSSGGPPRNTNGTYSRWRYAPSVNAFIVVNSTTSAVYAYKLTAGGGGTPPPTNPPTVTLTASPNAITAGASSTLTWSSTNATGCTASQGWSGAKGINGSETVTPAATASYELSCLGSGGSASATAAVTVSAVVPIPPPTSDADADWIARSTAAGVTTAQGFDTQQSWQSNQFPTGRANAWDQTVKASGAGAVRFDIRSQSGQGAVGNIVVDFNKHYGANSEFWLQWRQRFDAYVIDHNYAETAGSGEWKQIILAQGNKRYADGSTLLGYACSENQYVMNNGGDRDYPGTYIECGRYWPFESSVGGVLTRQNQRAQCNWTGDRVSTGCLRYYPNEWMTFMVHWKLGPQGTASSSVGGVTDPGFINSEMEFYVGRQGGPLEIAHRQTGIVVPRGQHYVSGDPNLDSSYSGGWTAHDAHRDAEFGKLWLTPFHTEKDASEVHQNASIWYDEVIVSDQPIAAPGGTVTPPPLPTAPTVALTAAPASVVSGSSAVLTWTSTNATSCTATGAWSGTRPVNGSETVTPSATATYSLSCTGTGGSTVAAATVVVTQPPPEPPPGATQCVTDPNLISTDLNCKDSVALKEIQRCVDEIITNITHTC